MPAHVVRASLLPILFLFALPAFGLWFGGYASDRYDARFLDAVLPQVRSAPDLGPAERAEAIAFYRRFPPSVVCASDAAELAPFRSQLGDACDDFMQFRAARLASAASLGLGGLALLVAIVCTLVSFLSRAAQYRSFVAGFHLLRLTSSLIVVLQAGLAVWLSFWLTAIWTERYYVKLILVAGVLAGYAVFAIVRSLFQKLPQHVEVVGLLVPEDRASPLFARIRELCAALGTAPPDNVVAGIDDNFFVVEGEVRCTDATLHGRTLFVSLSLLRVLSRSEADAVLAHEMAHFSGGDTEHSRKLAPALMRFGHYVAALASSPLSIPVARFMGAFRALFELSFGKTRREREHAADTAAAELTSPDDVARALIRIGAYSSYRTRVESTLFEHDALHAELGISARLASGFVDYVATPKLQLDLVDAHVPHPYDTHPPLLERIAHVGSTIRDADFAQVSALVPEGSWRDAIERADELESRQWQDYERDFAEVHEMALVHRYEPATEAERALVEKHFPPREWKGTDGSSIEMDCLILRSSAWSDTVPLASIKAALVADRMFKTYLDLTLETDGVLTSKHSICISVLGPEKDVFLMRFDPYWNRARMAAAYLAEKR